MLFDIIGDIHGHADTFEALLRRLGYQPHGRGFRCAGRHLVLVGDLIDRGPHQQRVLEIAQSMRDNGDATVLMGNHEFNALCYATPAAGGGFIRPHSEANRRQHQAFLDAFPFGSPEYQDAIGFFRTLPLWYEQELFRVVHACWFEPAMAVLAPLLNHDRVAVGDALFAGYGEQGSAVYEAAELVLKGPEVDLPEGVFFRDKDGKRRDRARVSWWKLQQGAAHSFELGGQVLGDEDMEDAWRDAQLYRYLDEKPLFFGHYWQRDFGSRVNTDGNAWCLDYSVAKGGELVAATIDDTGLIRWTSVPAS